MPCASADILPPIPTSNPGWNQKIYYEFEQFKRPVEVWSQAKYLDPESHDYDLYSLGPNGEAGGTGEAAPIYNE